MSAIFGLVFHRGNVEERKHLVGKIASTLSFRGDEETTILTGMDGLIGSLCFLREDITTIYTDGQNAVAFEGEIYNREQLIGDLHLPKDAGEGEIILSLYNRDGVNFPRQINGMFAIIVYDAKSGRYIIARDHAGLRSLYYAHTKVGTFLSTTIKSLLNTGVVSSALSNSGINSYFSSTAISPPDTLFDEISCIPPATCLILSRDGNCTKHDYWGIAEICEDKDRSFDSFSEELRELLVDTVKIRARSGPVMGSIVSGGVDSSFVSAVLARQQAESNELPVFSIAFAEKEYSDADLQQVMYDAFPFDPHHAIIAPQEYWDIMQRAVSHLDTPVNDDAIVGMYKVFELARSTGCDAVFEGEGADELFFTGHVHSERQFQQFLQVPYFLRRWILGGVLKNNAMGAGVVNKANRLLFRMSLSDTERRLMVLPSFYRTKRPILRECMLAGLRDPLATARKYLDDTRLQDPLNRYYFGIIKNFLPDDLLYKNERMASAHGITNRVPFCDYRLVELALKIPETFKVKKPTANDDGTKLVYKKAIDGLIPDRILYRKKTRGFSIPSQDWYRGKLKNEIDELILGGDAKYLDYLDKSYVRELYKKFQAGALGINYHINSIITFELWLRQFTG